MEPLGKSPTLDPPTNASCHSACSNCPESGFIKGKSYSHFSIFGDRCYAAVIAQENDLAFAYILEPWVELWDSCCRCRRKGEDFGNSNPGNLDRIISPIFII